MSKRARYDGSGSIRVYAPEDTYMQNPLDTVESGHLLSADVPAKIRDELLTRPDWSEVHPSSGGGSQPAKTESKSDTEKEG